MVCGLYQHILHTKQTKQTVGALFYKAAVYVCI